MILSIAGGFVQVKIPLLNFALDVAESSASLDVEFPLDISWCKFDMGLSSGVCAFIVRLKHKNS